MTNRILTQAKARFASANEGPTKATHKLTPWWSLLNSELARLGLPEALFKEARTYYEDGFAPELAARDIKLGRSV